MSNEDRNNLNNVHDENSSQTKEISPSYNSIDQITKDGYKILMEAIRNANALPSRRDWDFYGTHESFNTIITTESNKILKQINSILRSNDIEGNIRNRILEEKTELMIEANDMILEKAANNIDEMNGIRKTVVEPVVIQTVCAQLPVNGSWNRVNNATFSVSSSITSESSQKSANAIRLLTAKNIVRPQKFFKDKIINSSKYPWEPRIKEKPNSLKPLALFIEETQNGEEYTHPYEFELERFTPPADQLKKVIPAIPLKIEDTPLIEVNEPAQIEELIEVLRNCKEFAIDLEHHSYRSFMGITCLMQISTRKQDYLIDTLALRDKLYMLNEVFTKPSIVKIFHGADMDIQWLQKDLSLYVVNMFDTYHAAKQLGYTGLSLAFLMQKFCNFMPNKQFQLADWRIRPLPDELKTYAREDTHYLIYIYDMMKNELIDKANGQTNLLLSALNNSTETCKKRYFRPVLREDSHLDFYRKCKRLFDNRQLYALKELYKWRDQLSREQDESTGYVLPNHMLLQISETLPREMQGILACCNPIPPLVRSNLLEIHQIVLRAKEQSLEKPILKEDTRARGITKKMSKINVDSPLHCPHDLTKSGEFRDDLPTVMGKSTAENLRDITNVKLEIENDISVYTLFNEADDIDNKEKSENNLHSFTFLSPFERYKLVKPFIQAEEERLAIEKAEEEEKAKSDNNDPNNISRKDTRTDEERIESIREHFLSLAKKTGPATVDTDGEQNLIQMGGTKRKRAPSPQEQEYSSQETDLQTTVPNLNKGTFNPRKRKSTDMNNGSPSKVTKSKDAPLSAEKRTFNKKKWNAQRNRNNSDDHTSPNERIDNRNRQPNFKKRGQYHKNNDGRQRNDPLQEGSDNHQYHHREAHTGDNFTNTSDGRPTRAESSRGKNKNKNFKGHQQTNRPAHGEDFTPYDYSSVDFRQFQGGAGGTQRVQEVKSTFRSKGKKKKGPNKGNQNKSSTFANFGRHGGRGR